jgi:hypothetical protein
MSEIKVDTLTGKTSAGDITVTSEGGAATMQLQQGLAKAWMLFNEPSATLTDGLNISSASDLGTGHFQHSFTNSFSTANFNYSFGAGNNDGSGGGSTAQPVLRGYWWQTGSFNQQTSYNLSGSNVAFDYNSTGITFMGDLA